MRFFVWIFALLLGLSACGTKGPLYIPEQRYPQQQKPQQAPQSQQPTKNQSN